MAEGALTLTTDGLILFSNDQFASLVGLPLEKVIGSRIQRFLAREDAMLFSSALNAHKRTQVEVRFVGAAGQIIPTYLAINTLVLEFRECFCLIVTDLREQKRNEEIVASERLARSILEQSAGAILVVDPTGEIIRASRAAERLADTPSADACLTASSVFAM